MENNISADILDSLEDTDRNNILHDFTSMKNYEPHFMRTGKGSFVEDVHGKKYLDFKSCAFNVTLGYQHPRLITALKNQADNLCYTDHANIPSALLTHKILEILGSQDYSVFYSTAGSLAVETALKIARNVTRKQKIVSYLKNYHGSTYGSMAVTGSGYISSPFGPQLSHHVKVPPAYCYRCYFGKSYPDCDFQCVTYVEQVLKEENPYSIAAILAEPVPWGEMIVPPSEYWKRMREICDTYHILLIFDETVTGFGRTGTWFAYEKYVEPDILISGKGLTAGVLPLFATIIHKKISEYYRENMFVHGFTFQGYPLACAVALEVLKTMEEEGILQHVEEMGGYLFDALRTLKEKYSIIGDVRGMGLLYGCELVEDLSKKTPVAEAFTRSIVRETFSKGLIIGSVIYNFLTILPPLTVTAEEIDSGMNILDEVLGSVVAADKKR
jgi:taurine--2-oxoglutarate transaminase